MRLPFSAYIALGIGAAYMVGVTMSHAWSCRYRLARACRLYETGRIAEGDRVVSAVGRSVAAFRRRHPGWRLASIAGAPL